MGILSRIFGRRPAQSVNGSGWTNLIHEPATGAWQTDGRYRTEHSHSLFFAVFACVSKISQDIAKLPLKTKVRHGKVWQEKNLKRLAYLKKPNNYQTVQQLVECWILSKLLHGNAYIYKQRDVEGKVTALHILNPKLVTPLITDDGEVWYQIGQDNLRQLSDQSVTLPETEILHDRWNCFTHPLIGIPPLAACALAADNGEAIQKNSRTFFGNKATPSGILTAPMHIDAAKAAELARRWNENYSGGGAGKTAVLGDGMTYQQTSVNALDSQLVEQLKLSAEIVCSVFKMPPFLIGFGTLPSGMKVSDLNELYYSGCLQGLIESIENLLSQDLGDDVAVEVDLHSLIRMDASSQMQILADGVKASVLTINEARANRDLPPVDGGDTPYMQQQNYSLSALSKRDAQSNPFDTQTGGG